MVKKKTKKVVKRRTKKTIKKKTNPETTNTEDRKRFFECNKCGKKFEKVAWYEKHIRKCNKERVTVKAGEAGSGRTKDGKFGKGNKEGLGNPHWSELKRYREDYLKQFRDIFTPDMMSKVTMVMIYKAIQEKDIQSAKTLLEYAMGKPVARIEDELEGGPERKAMQIAEALKQLEM